jgi:hypothetical protein
MSRVHRVFLHGRLRTRNVLEATEHRDLIIPLAAGWQLPAVYPSRYFVNRGGLIAYCAVIIDQYRRGDATSTAWSRARNQQTSARRALA